MMRRATLTIRWCNVGNCTDPFNVWRNPNLVPNVWTGAVLPDPVFLQGVMVVNPDPANGSVEVGFSEELDTVSCDITNGVTVTVDGSPVNILSAVNISGPSPWVYEYTLDGAIGGCSDVVWAYDANNGCIGATSGAQLHTVETTYDFATSTITWVSDFGAPVVSGSQWECSDDTNGQTVYTSESTINPFTDSTELYAEFEIGQVTLDQPDDPIYAGWHNSADLSSVAIANTLGIYWQNSTVSWWVNRSLATATARSTTNTTPPVQGTRVGVAIDLANLKLFVNVDGVWLEDPSGRPVGGGPPSDGDGWAINNDNVNGFLWMASKDAPGCYAAVTPDYLPVGYTAVT